MVPSCISWSRFGMTKETVGKWLKSFGKFVKGMFTSVGTFVKLTHGLCFRAYVGCLVFGLLQPVKPTVGKSSE